MTWTRYESGIAAGEAAGVQVKDTAASPAVARTPVGVPGQIAVTVAALAEALGKGVTAALAETDADAEVVPDGVAEVDADGVAEALDDGVGVAVAESLGFGEAVGGGGGTAGSTQAAGTTSAAAGSPVETAAWAQGAATAITATPSGMARPARIRRRGPSVIMLPSQAHAAIGAEYQ